MPGLSAALERLELRPPLLYGITDRSQKPPADPSTYLREVFQSDAQIIQLREKDLTPDSIRPLIRESVRLASESRRLLLVNSFVEIALQEGADGVHLTSSQSIHRAQIMVQEHAADDFIIGKSVHSVREAVEAERQGADYVMLGPVFNPISKASQGPALGLATLREAVQMLYIPVVAVGGVEAGNLDDLFDAGVLAAAGISWLHQRSL